MEKLVCDICGGNLIVQPSGFGFATCDICGVQYSKESLQKKIHIVKVVGAVETIHGTAEKERLLKNATTYISLDKLEDARKLYDAVTKDYPDDYQGWWGLFSVYIREIEKEKIWQLDYINEPIGNAQTALKLFPELITEYNKIMERLVACVIEGEIIPVLHHHDNKKENGLRAAIKSLPEGDPFRSYFQQGLMLAEDFNTLIGSIGSNESVREVKRRIFSTISDNIVAIKGKWEYNSFQNYSAALILGKVIICAYRGNGYECDTCFYTSLILSKSWDNLNQNIRNIVATFKATKGGCYVATAVYGSYDCPQVWTLRRYRDYTLAETWYGRAFIHVYYAISPTLVKWFGDTAWFKKILKGKLDHIVSHLHGKGVEDTPYEDRIW